MAKVILLEIIFLYKRLYHQSKKQLQALKDGDLWLVEELTDEREKLTDQICGIIDNGGIDLNNTVISRKAHELTESILRVDEEIKEGLMNELIARNLGYSDLKVLK